MTWIYQTIIIPILSACSLIWAMELNKSQTAKITTIQTQVVKQAHLKSS